MQFANRLTIQVQVDCPRLPEPPAIDGSLAPCEALPELPQLSALEDRKAFARLWVAWWPEGLYFAARVAKAGPIAVNRQRPLQNDCIIVLINLQPSEEQRRPTRRCYQFIILPRGGGPDRMAPLAWHEFFASAPPQPYVRSERLKVAKAEGPEGYAVEVAIPAAPLGEAFSPGRVLGFECLVHDTQQGSQTWAAPPEAPVLQVPALWGLLRLVEGEGGEQRK